MSLEWVFPQKESEREREKKCFVVLGYPSLDRLKESKFNKHWECTRTTQRIFF